MKQMLKEVRKEPQSKETEAEHTHGNERQQPQEFGSNVVDSETALQNFLNGIPISSIPALKYSPALDLKAGDHLKDAIHFMYEKNVFGALITDISSDDPNTLAAAAGKFSDRYIGFIDFVNMVLWCLEGFEKQKDLHRKTNDALGNDNGFFFMLERTPHLATTKVVELAKSFVWDPFFPVHLDTDTLLHVMLLLSKHNLQLLPIKQRSTSQVTSFITQTAIIHLLLQSSGLEWFDRIGNRALSEFRFGNEGACQVYADQTIAEALEMLWRNRVSAVAVVSRGTRELVGTVRKSDVHLLIDNSSLFANRRTSSVAKFIHLDSRKGEQELIDSQVAGTLCLRNNFNLGMESPVTHRKTDTLKQAMRKMLETRSESSFLVDSSQQVCGLLTLRDIILEFAPPGVDSKIDGGSFFESALEQVGCHVGKGCLISDR